MVRVALLIISTAVISMATCAEKRDLHVQQNPLIAFFHKQKLRIASLEKVMLECFTEIQAKMTTLESALNIESQKTDLALKTMGNKLVNLTSDIQGNMEILTKIHTESQKTNLALITMNDRLVKQGNDLIKQEPGTMAFLQSMEQRLYSLRCAVGYLGNQQSCYKFVTSPDNWDSARQKCQSDGAHLAWITSRGEMEALRTLMETNGVHNAPYWIGGNDMATEGQWVWENGSKLVYTYWAPGQPGSVEDCLCIENAGGGYMWRDHTCSNLLPYICEM